MTDDDMNPAEREQARRHEIFKRQQGADLMVTFWHAVAETDLTLDDVKVLLARQLMGEAEVGLDADGQPEQSYAELRREVANLAEDVNERSRRIGQLFAQRNDALRQRDDAHRVMVAAISERNSLRHVTQQNVELRAQLQRLINFIDTVGTHYNSGETVMQPEYWQSLQERNGGTPPFWSGIPLNPGEYATWLAVESAR